MVDWRLACSEASKQHTGQWRSRNLASGLSASHRGRRSPTDLGPPAPRSPTDLSPPAPSLPGCASSPLRVSAGACTEPRELLGMVRESLTGQVERL